MEIISEFIRQGSENSRVSRHICEKLRSLVHEQSSFLSCEIISLTKNRHMMGFFYTKHTVLSCLIQRNMLPYLRYQLDQY